MSDSHSLAADLDAGRACSGLPRSDERASSEPGCDGRLAARLETLSRQPSINHRAQIEAATAVAYSLAGG